MTPSGNRIHVGIFGSCNSGKSTLVNAIANQDVALVSEYAGTTTDPVYKAMEIKGVGAVTLIDTAGYDDTTQLSKLRAVATQSALIKTDLAILVYRGAMSEIDRQYIEKFLALEIPYIIVRNTVAGEKIIEQGLNFASIPIVVNAKDRVDIDKILSKIVDIAQQLAVGTHGITKGYVSSGDCVVLVMPQDASAPTGRLILPQVQTIRELLDQNCIVTCTTTEGYADVLSRFSTPPSLVITDSQVFDVIYEKTPKGIPLTSFSILFAGQKGDISQFLEGAKAITKLNSKSRVLIAEACTHAPQSEDIGRVKIPAMLKQRFGVSKIDIVAGNDFPDKLSDYDLIIHCGACMFNRRHLINRINSAKSQKVAITNYGIAIAFLKGILDKVVIK